MRRYATFQGRAAKLVRCAAQPGPATHSAVRTLRCCCDSAFTNTYGQTLHTLFHRFGSHD